MFHCLTLNCNALDSNLTWTKKTLMLLCFSLCLFFSLNPLCNVCYYLNKLDCLCAFFVVTHLRKFTWLFLCCYWTTIFCIFVWFYHFFFILNDCYVIYVILHHNTVYLSTSYCICSYTFAALLMYVLTRFFSAMMWFFYNLSREVNCILCFYQVLYSIHRQLKM